jgi:general secretion pathway protein G
MDRKRRAKQPGGQRGLTLIEILVVLFIVALLAGLVAPRVLTYLGPSRMKAAKAQITALETVAQEFYLKNGRFPTQQEGLDVLKPLIGKEIPLDPWGRPYSYRAPGQQGDFDIVSFGRDGTEGGEGEDQDVVSWKDIVE